MPVAYESPQNQNARAASEQELTPTLPASSHRSAERLTQFQDAESPDIVTQSHAPKDINMQQQARRTPNLPGPSGPNQTFRGYTVLYPEGA